MSEGFYFRFYSIRNGKNGSVQCTTLLYSQLTHLHNLAGSAEQAINCAIFLFCSLLCHFVNIDRNFVSKHVHPYAYFSVYTSKMSDYCMRYAYKVEEQSV